MTHASAKAVLFGVLVAIAGAWVVVNAQQPAADIVLLNGKIITVDDHFSIAQAIAIRGDRFVAVGTNEQITRLAGPSTRRIDLKGRSVTPGFIDNHAHFMEEGAYWQLETRLDGVDTRREALEILRARAKGVGPGKWVFVLGGWSTDQFIDDKKPFTKDELDRALPDNPVLLQFTRCCTFLNSRAIAALALDGMKEPWVLRDASGRPTGVIQPAGADRVSGHLTKVPKEIFESSSLSMIRDLNRVGLTASGGACMYADTYREWARAGRLNMRFYCFLTAGRQAGGVRSTPALVDAMLPLIPQLRYFQGDNWIDFVNWGEGLYSLGDNVTDLKPSARPEDFVQWGRVAREVAKAGISIFIHSTMEWNIEGELAQVELVNKERSIRPLRWSFIHVDQITPNQIERMKNMGMSLAVHSRTSISGALVNRIHGDRSYDMPPLKTIHDSGIHWGLGTDAFEVNQYRPFTTLWWAVTGKMVGGTAVSRQTIGREDALVAHTRSNAYFFFRENDLGSIQAGKLADLVVIDRDYLTIPADQIKDIKPMMTMVGGRIVFDTENPTSTQ